jgi:elongation factor Ts
MEITAAMVKELRETTGAGVLDCKKALEESGGDTEKAAAMLRQRGITKAAKKASRVTGEGRIETYVHTGNKVASLMELRCETDFVARTEDFQNLAHDLAMQIAAAKPLYLSPEHIPGHVLEEKRSLYRQEAEGTGKPENILDKIVEGKLKSFQEEACLLLQPFIKDTDKTVQEIITDCIAKLGENIQVARFVRFELGEEDEEA